MKNSIFAGALLLSGTLLLIADMGSFSLIGLLFMVMSFLIWLWRPLSKLTKHIFSPINEENQE